MKYYEDITTMHGDEAVAVDVIIGGSPCQDLSVAGQRAGLDGERSSLFLDQIRVIKEAHSKYGRNKPRYMVWENVPGALSSANGEDFRRVLEETAKVADETAVIPRPEKGKWTTAGAVVGDGYSIAWRILDAQFWGVPQRCRRIALVADFAGQSAPEILFKSESVSGHTAESGETRKGTAGSAESGTHETGEPILLESNQNHATIQIDGISTTLPASMGMGGGYVPMVVADRQTAYSFDSLSSNSMKSNNPHSGCREVDVAKTIDTTIPDPSKNQGGVAVVMRIREGCEGGGKGPLLQYDKSGTLGTSNDQYLFEPAICIQGNCIDRADTAGCNGRGWRDDDVSYTLNTIDRPAVYDARGNGNGETVPTITGDHQNRVTDYTAICCASSHAGYSEGVGTLRAAGDDLGSEIRKPVCSIQKRSYNLVRRLTPLEAERLQGYPDEWTDIGEWTDSKGKKHQTTDSARYKALGNSIALPPWRFVCRRICEQYDTPATMGSLFDGIGGFPLIWREINGADSVPWACEIDEYCRAVTQRRLP